MAIVLVEVQQECKRIGLSDLKIAITSLPQMVGNELMGALGQGCQDHWYSAFWFMPHPSLESTVKTFYTGLQLFQAHHGISKTIGIRYSVKWVQSCAILGSWKICFQYSKIPIVCRNIKKIKLWISSSTCYSKVFIQKNVSRQIKWFFNASSSSNLPKFIQKEKKLNGLYLQKYWEC